MMEAFFALEKEKQERILNVALKEFAEHGYKDASTNSIVKEAGIGKGMLFYYFKSKRELFLYLIEYAMEVLNRDYLSRLDYSSPDYIERLRHATEVKLWALNRYPYVFAFGGSLHLNGGAEVPPDVMARIVSMQRQIHTKRLENLDMSRFRDDVKPQTILEMVQWSIEGYERKLSAQIKAAELANSLAEVDYRPYIEEFYAFLEVLKTIYYKKEAEE